MVLCMTGSAGAAIFGNLADTVGRKPATLTAVAGFGVTPLAPPPAQRLVEDGVPQHDRLADASARRLSHVGCEEPAPEVAHSVAVARSQ
jgi:hypothetical protein